MNSSERLVFIRQEKSGAVIVDVHVIPNAEKTCTNGTHDGALRVRLHAPPVDGKANRALEQWLADELQVARSAVAVIRGQTARRKQLRVEAEAAAHARWDRLRSGQTTGTTAEHAADLGRAQPKR